MSSIVDTVFGGQNDDAIKEQRRSNDRTQGFIEDMAGKARTDVKQYLPEALSNQREAYQEAIQLLRRVPRQQTEAIQNASMNAQGTLLGGMNEFRNSILGVPNQIYQNISKNAPQLRPKDPIDYSKSNASQPSSAGWMTEMPSFLQTQNAPANQGGQATPSSFGELDSNARAEFEKWLNSQLGGSGTYKLP